MAIPCPYICSSSYNFPLTFSSLPPSSVVPFQRPSRCSDDRYEFPVDLIIYSVSVPFSVHRPLLGCIGNYCSILHPILISCLYSWSFQMARVLRLHMYLSHRLAFRQNVGLKSTKVAVRVPSTPVQLLGNWDQLPDLRLVTCNDDPSYGSRHPPKALPPPLFLILLPQVIHVVGGFPPLLVLERTGRFKIIELTGGGDPLPTISLKTSVNETSMTRSSGEVFIRATAKELRKAVSTRSGIQSPHPSPVDQPASPQLQVTTFGKWSLPQPYPRLSVLILVYCNDFCVRDDGPSFVGLKDIPEIGTMSHLPRLRSKRTMLSKSLPSINGLFSRAHIEKCVTKAVCESGCQCRPGDVRLTVFIERHPTVPI